MGQMAAREHIEGQIKKHHGNHTEIHIITALIIGMIPFEIPGPQSRRRPGPGIIGIFHHLQGRRLSDVHPSLGQGLRQPIILLVMFHIGRPGQSIGIPSKHPMKKKQLKSNACRCQQPLPPPGQIRPHPVERTGGTQQIQTADSPCQQQKTRPGKAEGRRRVQRHCLPGDAVPPQPPDHHPEFLYVTTEVQPQILAGRQVPPDHPDRRPQIGSVGLVHRSHSHFRLLPLLQSQGQIGHRPVNPGKLHHRFLFRDLIPIPHGLQPIEAAYRILHGRINQGLPVFIIEQE